MLTSTVLDTGTHPAVNYHKGGIILYAVTKETATFVASQVNNYNSSQLLSVHMFACLLVCLFIVVCCTGTLNLEY